MIYLKVYGIDGHYVHITPYIYSATARRAGLVAIIGPLLKRSRLISTKLKLVQLERHEIP